MPASARNPLFASALALLAAQTLPAQELLLREDFNTDGATATPPRYTITGGFKSEVPHNTDDVGNAADMLGPVYWARNTEVSFAGVPAPTQGRRALLVWDGTLAAADASAEALNLVANTVKWLAKDKANATILVSPNVAAIGGLADHLSGLGYTLADDDPAVPEASVAADALLKAPGGGPSRFATSRQGVLTFSAADHDDMLVSSIGVTAAFEASQAAITAPSHPVAAGVPASFQVASGSRTWNLMGDILPGGATTVATVVRRIPPTAASLADVDAMAAGTKTSVKTSETQTELDYSDGSPGDYTTDSPLPGGASGVWGLVARGKLNVKAAGRYSFALGMDDGARLRIDRNRNGLGAEDNVIVEDAAGGHRARYGDVTFDSTGLYDFEVAVFNSGGAGGIEMSISTQAGGGDTSAISSGTWESLGSATGQVALQGNVAVDVLVPSGEDQVQTLPFLVLLNGPTDTPPGAVFGGGPFEGFEGAGFFGGSGLNKWNPEPIGDLGGYRSVRLKPVNVAGKQNLKVTVALAATFLDFETSDFLDIIAYPNGESSTPVTLARYSAPDANSKYFVDVTHGNINRLGLRFQDVTYDIPAGATDLVIELRAATTWWNEIVVFDDVRVTAGAAEPFRVSGVSLAGNDVRLTWTGGQPPFEVWTGTVGGAWRSVTKVQERSATVARQGDVALYQIRDRAP